MDKQYRLWSAEDFARARQFMESGGVSFRQCDEHFGRVHNSTYNKFKVYAQRTDNMDWLRRLVEASKLAGLARHAKAAAKRLPVNHIVRIERVDKAVIAERAAERARAYGGDFTLSQRLLGDPPVGRSALDQRKRLGSGQ